MRADIILSGVGGQGILSIAAVIGEAALKEGLYMKQAEVHGMSQRGGDVQSNLRPDHFTGTDGESSLSSLSEKRGMVGDKLSAVRQYPELSGYR